MSRDNIQMVYARNLRDRRKRLGLTQSELAERIGVSTSFITEIETGRKAPSFVTMEKISHTTGIPVWVYFCDRGDTIPEGVFQNMEMLKYTLKDSVYNAIDKVLTELE